MENECVKIPLFIGTARKNFEDLHMKKVRVAARAIIIQDGKILLNKNQKFGQVYYTLPGRGQEHGETIEEAVKRECLEETGAEIKVLNLCFVRDYISSSHEFAEQDPDFHQLELIFRCEMISEIQPERVTEMDAEQIGTEWIKVEDLKQVKLFPQAITELIIAQKWIDSSIYLGNIN